MRLMVLKWFIYLSYTKIKRSIAISRILSQTLCISNTYFNKNYKHLFCFSLLWVIIKILFHFLDLKKKSCLLFSRIQIKFFPITVTFEFTNGYNGDITYTIRTSVYDRERADTIFPSVFKCFNKDITVLYHVAFFGGHSVRIQ